MKGKHPFGDDLNYRATNIVEGNSVNLEQLSDSLARDFVGSMIRHNIEDRPYVQEALKYPFLQIKPGNYLFLHFNFKSKTTLVKNILKIIYSISLWHGISLSLCFAGPTVSGSIFVIF